MIVPARRRAPRSQNYRTGVWSGLGLVAPVYESCGFDAACIARNNVLEQAYLKQLYAEQGISDISSPGGVVSQRDPVTGAVLTPDSGNVQPTFGTPIGTPTVPQMQGQQGNTLTTFQDKPVPVVSVPTVRLAPLTPQGQVIGTSSGTQGAPGAAAQVPASSGFDLSSIPWYLWAGGAIAAVYFIGGRGGR